MNFVLRLIMGAALMSRPTFDPEIPGHKGNPVEEEIDDGIEYNGWHYDLNDKWIPGMPTFASQFMLAPDVFTGDAWPYSWGVMEATARENGLSLDNVVDGVALMTCADHGGLVWLKRVGHNWEGPFKVVDCARRNDLYNTAVHRNEAVEVGFKTTVKWGMATNRKMIDGKWDNYWPNPTVKDVIVSKIPPDQIPANHLVIDYSEWFLENVTFDNFETNRDAERYYRSVPTRVYRPPVEKEGLPTWRIPPSSEFIEFDLITVDDLEREQETIIEDVDQKEIEKFTVYTPTLVKKSFEVGSNEFWISVDLSEQKLYAHIGGDITREFIVSTGLLRTPTPLGSYEIYAMYEDYTMVGVDGPIPNVKWSMFFHNSYAIHGAYWHNNFGERMSRGCVNMTNEDAKWIYDRVEENGTRIYVHE